MKIFLSLLLFLPFFCFSQKQGNIWYFGDHAGIDFSTGVPVVIHNGQAVAEEGTAVICDSSGALLFYSNGEKAWNKNHQVMLNGDSLMGYNSSTQSSLIVPKPESSDTFYLFTTDGFQNNLTRGLRYSIVDMCLDGGLGGIIPGQKNLFLLDTVSEKLTGVRHSNGSDYWVIAHKFYSDAFYAYQLSANGIVDTVITHIGSVHPCPPPYTAPLYQVGGAIGQLKASPDGHKLAIVTGNGIGIAEYFDFDNSNGVISNCVSVQTNPAWQYYGVSFSPDNSKLYIACAINGNAICQFDLNAGGGNPASVIGSMTTIIHYANYLGLQLANNGKIYSARSPFGYNPYLGVINNPNAAGLACNYVDSAVNLGTHSAYGFPNFIDSYNYTNNTFKCTDVSVKEFDSQQLAQIYPNPFTSQLHIHLNRAVNNSFFTLFDYTGKQILQEALQISFTIDTKLLPQGIYFYEVISQNEILGTGKIIKE